MLLTDKVKVKINPNNWKHLQLLGYDNLKKNNVIEIPVNHLSDGSGHKVLVKCDVCGKEKDLSYRRYLKSYNNGGYYACSNKCNLEKRKYEHTDEVKEKRKNTNIKKYGVDNFLKTDEYKEWFKINNPMFLDDVKEKYKKSIIEKHDVDNISKSAIVKKKKEKTCLKNHGVKSPYQNRDIFEKSLNNGLKILKFRNTDLFYQGSYEKDFLDRYYDKIKIRKGLSVEYIHNNKSKIYHSDFYLPDYNLMIEIKSTYWYNLNKDINILKEEYSRKSNHNFIIILDKDYETLDKVISNYTSIP